MSEGLFGYHFFPLSLWQYLRKRGANFKFKKTDNLKAEIIFNIKKKKLKMLEEPYPVWLHQKKKIAVWPEVSDISKGFKRFSHEHINMQQVCDPENTQRTYIFRLKHMAYHLVLLLRLGCPGRGFDTVLGGRARHPASRHQHHDVSNVSDVGNGTQRVVHHRFLSYQRKSGQTRPRKFQPCCVYKDNVQRS